MSGLLTPLLICANRYLPTTSIRTGYLQYHLPAYRHTFHTYLRTYCMPSYITYLPAHSTHVYPSIRSDVCQRFCAVFHAMNAIDCLLCPSFPRPSFFLFRGNTHAQVLGVLWCVLASISPFLIGLYLYCLLVFSLHCSRNIAHPAPVPHAGS